MYRDEVNSYIETIGSWVEEDGVEELVAAEFGTYVAVRIDKKDEPKSIQYVFEEGEGKLDGFFVFDPPKGFGTPIKGSHLESVVKEEFEKIK